MASSLAAALVAPRPTETSLGSTETKRKQRQGPGLALSSLGWQSQGWPEGPQVYPQPAQGEVEVAGQLVPVQPGGLAPHHLRLQPRKHLLLRQPPPGQCLTLPNHPGEGAN